MSIEEKVSLTISIDKSYKDKLRIMAAQQNLHDPDQLTSASTIAREIICEYIDKIERLETSFKEAAREAEQQVESDRDQLPEAAAEN